MTGDDLVLAAPLQTPGTVWWVNSATGTDAASPAGKDREKPLATLAQAQTNASAGDIVFLEAGHTEIYTVALTLSKSLTIAAGGDANGSNPVSFSINAANQSIFTISSAASQIRNVLFKASVQSNVGPGAAGKVSVSAANVEIIGCRFESSAFDQFTALRLTTGADGFKLTNTRFISTATTTATRPTRGFEAALSVTDLRMDGVVFDDGTVGYSTAACDLNALCTRVFGIHVSALRGADILMNASTTGWLNLQTSTGGGRVVW